MTDHHHNPPPSEPPTYPGGTTPDVDFDLDEDSITTLLDGFIERQTGRPGKPSSHPPDPSDAGAQAAQRTVLEHASRRPSLPLVGNTSDAKRGRVALLHALIRRCSGSARARLLAALGELREQLGEREEAREAYEEALAADARDVLVLRALRRDAVQREDWSRAVELLEREASLDLTSEERGAALKLLAETYLAKLSDPARAEQAATRAVKLRGDDFVALIQIARARLVRREHGRAAEALVMAATCWPASSTRTALLLQAAQLMEEAGAFESAFKLYGSVLEAQPTSWVARMGLVRACRELGKPHGVVEQLSAGAELAPSTPLGDAAQRAAATAAGWLLKDHESAVDSLAGVQAPTALWTLAEHTALAGDRPAAAEALERFARAAEQPAASHLARARAGRLRSLLGQHSHAEQLWSQASSSDDLLAYIEATRERYRSDDANGSTGEHPNETIAAIGAIDQAAMAGDGTAFFSALRKLTEADGSHDPIGGILGLAEVAEDTGTTTPELLLGEARKAAPGELLLARASTTGSQTPADAAIWAEEAAYAEGSRAAFAHMMAAHIRSRHDEDPTEAYAEALEKQPHYLPALWALEDSPGPAERRAMAAAGQAAVAIDHDSGALAHLRAALWSNERQDRLAHLEAAIGSGGAGAILAELLIAQAGRRTRAAADGLLAMADEPDGLANLRRAATAYLASGFPKLAASALRRAQEKAPDDPIVQTRLQDAELRAAEFARVAGTAMKRAREAVDDHERLSAFRSMADIDRFARHDMQGARLSLQSIAEMRPDDVYAARTLEWDALRERDRDRIIYDAHRVARVSEPGTPERLARLRLAVEVQRADPDITDREVDRELRRHVEEPLEGDPVLARRLLGSAYAHKDEGAALQALEALQKSMQTRIERDALAIEASGLIVAWLGDSGRALEAIAHTEGHPLALEHEAYLLQSAERWREAAAAFQEAAGQAKDRTRAASLWHAAGRILQEEVGDTAATVPALEAAAEADVAYFDVYRRLAALYRKADRLEDWADLTERRLRADPDTPTRVQLLLEQGRFRRQQGDLPGAIAALQACLRLAPNHVEVLQELFQSYSEHSNWQKASQALIAIARLKRSAEEQCWAFSELSRIYEEHLDDLPRAEASLRRVLKLAPDDADTLDRLAAVLSSQGEAAEAAELLEKLLPVASHTEQEREFRVRLAFAHERMGQARKAERALDDLRVEDPTDAEVIIALADHYGRQEAPRAQAMHLNRAAADLRSAIDETPNQPGLWATLVEVLRRRHGPGPASCAAAAAVALGHSIGDLAEWDAHREGGGPLPESVQDAIAPRSLPQGARRLFALCEPGFDKAMPFESSAWQPRKASRDLRSIREEFDACARTLALSDAKLLTTTASQTTCMPVSSAPPTLLIGAAIGEKTSARERKFLFLRALTVAAAHLSAPARAKIGELEFALRVLVRGHALPGADEAERKAAASLRRRLIRGVPRRQRGEVEGLLLELRGDSDFSEESVGLSVAEFGNRAALILTGDIPGSVDALLKVVGAHVPIEDPLRAGVIRQSREAWGLIRFAISDAYFEARRLAGIDP